MKKRLLIFLLYFVTISKNLQAQYVAIPDDGFRNELGMKFGDCFFNGLLDTTCADIINEDSLTIDFISTDYKINNLDGMQYFKSLKYFYCYINNGDYDEPDISFIKLLPVSLEYLFLDGFKGTIPAEIGNFTNLTSLELVNRMKLTGSIPNTIGNLTKLKTLRINQSASSDKKITGFFPASITNLTNLEYLQTYTTRLSGPIPSSIGNLTKLSVLDLSYNFNLIDSIPSSIANCTGLTSLNLEGNQLNWNIPSSIGNLKNLTFLKLARNQLTGNIPEALSNLTQLSGLDFAVNQLTGSIPESFKKLTNLETLNLHSNKLSGSIPNIWDSLSKFRILRLSNNQFSDNIPAALYTCPLEEAHIASNRFNFTQTEDFVTKINPAIYFTYSPQAGIALHSKNHTLSVSAGGTLSNNTYKWYNNAQLVAIKYGDSIFTPTSKGNYYVLVTNTIAAGLTLKSDTLTVSTVALKACNGSAFTIISDITGSNYQWQVNNGSGYSNVIEEAGYSGSNTSSLQINAAQLAVYGYTYRCVADNTNSTAFTIQLTNTWTGNIDSHWENPGNWSCNNVPDNNTDVIVNSGSITINSNITCRSLNVQNGAAVTVTEGNTLTILYE